jgi:DNA/RNA endonuclease YhcR with UshA esterase domain
LQLVTMAGGSIPIATARDLIGNTVTVEGIVTMFPGGFFAGSGAKIYIEDEEGGIQVYMPGGLGGLDVAIGDQVRVSGEVELYRDSIELVPANMPDDMEIIQAGAAEP